MRKFKFYHFIAIASAMVLSVSSCTKDLEDDVDQLKKEVAENKSAIAALDQAIKAGKLITKVETVATGFLITFSDGNTITVTNGTNGTNGTPGLPGSNGDDGAPGLPGAPGAPGFAPIIGIDAENYWTVVDTEGGTPKRILADGKPIKAVGTANVEVKDGYLWIDGVKTALGGLPTVVINDGNGTAMITMYENGVAKVFTVLLANKAAGLTAISTPFAGEYEFSVDSTLVANSFVGGVFQGILAKGQVLLRGELQVVVSPANTDISNAVITLIDSKGNALNVNAKATPATSLTTRAASPSGVWTISFTEKESSIVGLSNKTAVEYLAVKIGNIQSGFDYKLKKGEALGGLTLPQTKTASIAAGKTLYFANYIDEKGVAANSSFDNIDPTLIYKSEIKLAEGQEALVPFITIDQIARTVSSKNTNEAIAALTAKKVVFVYTIVDMAGASTSYPLGVYDAKGAAEYTITYHNSNVLDVYPLTAVDYELNLTKKTIVYDLKELFGKLGTTETNTWRSVASNFTTTAYDAKDVKVTDDAITFKYLKADGITEATGGSDIQNIEMTFDPSKALGNYKLEFTYTDSRGITPFTATINVTVKNPTNLLQKTALFNGQKLTVYGTNQVTIADNVFDLSTAYTFNDANTVLTFSTTAIGAEINSDKNFEIKTLAKEDTEYAVNVKAVYFGNDKNFTEDVILVSPQSAIEHGKVTQKTTGTGTSAKVVPFELEYNKAAQTKGVALSTIFTFTDAMKANIVVFGAKTVTVDPRISISVEIDPTNANAKLLKVADITDSKDQEILINYSESAIPSSSFSVPVIITLTDKYGKKLIHKQDFKVVIK